MKNIASGIRQRKSGNYEVRVHRNKKAMRLGTYLTLEEAVLVRDKFLDKNKPITKITHGMKHTNIYKCWQNMKTRCLNKNNKQYKDYGGKGISICSGWVNSFESFYLDMKNGYNKDLEIDRINNDGNYCKENCRWVTASVNCANKRPSTGVRKLPSGRFFASIKIEKIKYSLETFDTFELAHNEFKKMHLEWYGF